jgi:hypothetical protein
MVLLAGGGTYNKEEEGRRKEKEKKKKKKKEKDPGGGGGGPTRVWSFALPSPFVFKLFELAKFNKVWRLSSNVYVIQRPRIKGLRGSIQASLFIFHINLNLARGACSHQCKPTT